MYKCRECEDVFAKPEKGFYYERVEYWGCVTNERFSISVCPTCGYEDFVKHEEPEEAIED